jgi:hypothetical protein
MHNFAQTKVVIMFRISSLFLLFTISCFHVFSQDKIYWGNQNTDIIYQANASDFSSLLSPVSATNPNGIAFYNANPTNPLFFASGNVIYKNNVGSSSIGIITTTGQFNRGLAIDYVAKKIYWANQGEGFIKRANLDGTSQESVLTGLTNPWDIELDLVNSKIYWTEDQAAGNIKRANMADGSSVESVITNIQSLGVAVDPLRGKIYYTDFTGKKVHSANLNGTGVTSVVSTGLLGPSDIDVEYNSGSLYFTDYNVPKVYKCDANGGNLISLGGSAVFVEYADVTTPIITSIVRQSPASTDVFETSTATFRVEFSEPMLNIDATDFVIASPITGTIQVTPVSLNKIFDVSVSSIAGTGTLNLNIASGHNAIDMRGNAFTGTITSEETYTVKTPPTLTTFTPQTGAEGTSVTLSGTNFSLTPANNIVKFNGTTATVTASTATSITTAVPAGATTGKITVTINGFTLTSSTNFTIPAPTITSFTPLTGSAGTSVTITGTNFSTITGNNAVKFNSTAATVTASTTTSITTSVPSGASSGSITVTVNGNTATSSTSFTVPVVAISSFTPQTGAEGTSVVITGTNFSATPANNTVKFNNKTAVVTASSATSITTSVPAGASSGVITVTVGGQTATSSTNFTVPAPTITSFTPQTGSEGTSVTITGTNFSTLSANNIVKFNGTTAIVTASTTTSITTSVPAGITTGPITVTVNGNTATSSTNFGVPVPTITSFTPESGSVGTSVVITGTNFSATPANNIVKFNGSIATATASTTTSITTSVPLGASSGAITVTVSGQTATSSTNFTVLVPSIISFTPGSGSIGTSVVITGTNFSTTPANNTVKFNDATATVTASTATSITTTVPSGASTGVITVIVDGVTAISSSNFTVVCGFDKPTISSSGGLLTSSSATGNQWLKNGVGISGATNQTYEATTPGLYAVKVTASSCSQVSDPVTITDIEESSSTLFTVYPNPSQAMVQVEVDASLRNSNVEIFTILGEKKERVSLSKDDQKLVGKINIENYPSGLYILVITTEKGIRKLKLEKQ